MSSQVMMSGHAFLIRTPEEAVQHLNEWSGQEITAESLRDTRARLTDTSRQEAKRWRLLEILERPDPIWNPAQHPELDAEGGAAAWVEKIRREEERASDSAQLTKAVFEDFVRLVEGIPKVWAVYVRSDGPVVHIWTYVDSTNWRDRSPVYNVEWEMLNRYPKTPFDFNVELAAAGSEQFEGEETAYLFKR